MASPTAAAPSPCRGVGIGEPLAFVDTRNPVAWGEADSKLPGAMRVPADEVERHMEEIRRERAVIIYCT